MSTEFSKDTDKKQKEKLKSSLVYAVWTASVAVAGQEAGFEVRTAFVGEGAPIKITGKSEKGKKLGKLTGKVRGNRFHGKLEIPEDIELGDNVYYEVKCSKNSISEESIRIPAKPGILINSMKWGQEETKRGETVDLKAELEGLNTGSEVEFVIYEYDPDGAHEKITTLPGTVRDGKVTTKWEFNYPGDVSQIPTKEEMEKSGGDYQWPTLFFTLKYEEYEHGTDQKSGLLKFTDWFKVTLIGQQGKVLSEQDYILHLPNGEKMEGKSDADGVVSQEGLPPGRCRIELTVAEDEDSDSDSS